MSQFAHEHPEDFEERLDTMLGHADLAEPEPCRVCGEYLTKGGRTCDRCERNLEEERLDKETQGL